MSPARWRLVLTRSRRWLVLLLGTRQVLRTRTKLLIAVSIFALSFATKSLHAVDLANLMYTTEQPFGGLTESYDRRAVSILAGEGLLGPYGIEPSNTQWITQAPGYSIFLSGVYAAFGRDFFKVQLVQNAINSLSALLIFSIAGSLVSWRVGIVSGLLAALSHHLGYISNFILPDAMSALPVLAALYLVLKARRRNDALWLYVVAGVAIGLAAWLRSQTMLLGVFLMVMLAVVSRRHMSSLKRGALLAMFSLLTIAPITIRNYVVYGEFIPIQLGTGITLWEGIGDAGGDRFGAVRDDTEVAAQEAELYGDQRYAGSWATPDGIRRDRDRTRRSLGIILRHPIWYAGVMVDRCGGMLKYSAHAPLVFGIDHARAPEHPAPIKRNWEPLASEGSSPMVGHSIFWLRPVVRVLQRTAKETLLFFIILGAFVLFAASVRRAMILSIVPLYYFLFQAALHTEFRYTLPMQYFMFVFAACGWVLILAGCYKGARALKLKAGRG